jgi:putative transposase
MIDRSSATRSYAGVVGVSISATSTSKYGQSFDAAFEAEDVDVIKSAPRAPRMNAHCERVIGSIRREALDHILITGEAHARQVLAAW